MATDPSSGFTLTTSSVSVRAVDRDSAESTPVSRMLIRDFAVSGVASGVAS